MNKNGSVTNLQLGSLAFTFVFSTAIAFIISPLAEKTSTTGWWCILFGGVMGLALVSFGARYAMHQPSEYAGVHGKKVVGKAVHTVILLLISFFLLHLASFILREFTDFFVLTYLRETPPIAVSVLVMGAVVALTQSGIPAVFRFAQGTFLFIGLFFLVKPLFFLNNLHAPIWHELIRIRDWKMLWTQSFCIIPWFGELILFLFIMPHFASPKRIRKALWWGALAGMYIFIAEYVLIIVFFGPNLAATLVYPALEVAGFIHLGDFVHDMDAIIVTIWFTAFFIKLSILFAVGTLVASQALALKNYKFITAPIAAFVVLLSVHQAKNPADLSDFFDRCWATYALTIELLPFLYPLVTWMRRRIGKPVV
ncbi:GerAB/ArcD/ProY family transporter [Cohnella yongneupensis]|uniref:GerAB/ArcD/ProY family transporter n=1 Tax=Cohnella yongneupensis TaxID=425006 RepID=A0ABW0R0P5_9BACL